MKDASRKCKWEFFDMHPDPTKCPSNCFNLWRGFAAEGMAPDVDLEALEPEVKDGLACLRGHVTMLCEIDGPKHEEFLLDFMAHLVQFPNIKFGVMCCLVGIQGLGKTQLWEAIVRMLGRHRCFETGDPARDVWGDNNDQMRTAFMVRLNETDKTAFKGHLGKVKSLITDTTIRVRSQYGAASNVKSYTRYFSDTNDQDAIPDSNGERRFFMLNCNTAKVGDMAYFNALSAAIQDDRVIRAFYLCC